MRGRRAQLFGQRDLGDFVRRQHKHLKRLQRGQHQNITPLKVVVFQIEELQALESCHGGRTETLEVIAPDMKFQQRGEVGLETDHGSPIKVHLVGVQL